SSVTSGLPLTWIVSCRCCGSTHPAGVLYCPCALNSSMKSSSTVGPTLVNPQPMRRLWPTITNGTPGSVTPATSKSPLFVVACKCAAYQRFGIWWLRCISFESNGFPETVCAPETAQLFDPGRKESESGEKSAEKKPSPADEPADEPQDKPEVSRCPPWGSTSSSSSSSSPP